MKLSDRVQKFHISLALITWIGFVGILVIWGSYAFWLGNKELAAQKSEIQYLREKNKLLTEQNQELEHQLDAIQADCSTTQRSGSETGNIEAEIRAGSERSFTYIVQKGDTIWDIAMMYNVEVNDLLRWNNLGRRSQIFPGDTLIIILDE